MTRPSLILHFPGFLPYNPSPSASSDWDVVLDTKGWTSLRARKLRCWNNLVVLFRALIWFTDPIFTFQHDVFKAAEELCKLGKSADELVKVTSFWCSQRCSGRERGISLLAASPSEKLLAQLVDLWRSRRHLWDDRKEAYKHDTAHFIVLKVEANAFRDLKMVNHLDHSRPLERKAPPTPKSLRQRPALPTTPGPSQASTQCKKTPRSQDESNPVPDSGIDTLRSAKRKRSNTESHSRSSSRLRTQDKTPSKGGSNSKGPIVEESGGSATSLRISRPTSAQAQSEVKPIQSSQPLRKNEGEEDCIILPSGVSPFLGGNDEDISDLSGPTQQKHGTENLRVKSVQALHEIESRVVFASSTSKGYLQKIDHVLDEQPDFQTDLQNALRESSALRADRDAARQGVMNSQAILDNVLKERSKFQGERDAAYQEAGRFRVALDNALEESTTVRRERDAAGQEAGSLRATLENLRQQSSKLRDERSTVRKALELSQINLCKSRQESSSLYGELGTTQEALKDSQTTLDMVRKESSSLRNELGSIKEALENTQSTLDKALKESSSLRSELDTTQEALKSSKATIENAQKDAFLLRGELDAAREECKGRDALRSALHKALRENIRIRGEHDTARREFDSFWDVSREVEDENDRLHSELANVKRELEMLKDALHEAQKENTEGCQATTEETPAQIHTPRATQESPEPLSVTKKEATAEAPGVFGTMATSQWAGHGSDSLHPGARIKKYIA